jgi:hypothetical protein
MRIMRTGGVGDRALSIAEAIIHIVDTEEGSGQKQKATLWVRTTLEPQQLNSVPSLR